MTQLQDIRDQAARAAEILIREAAPKPGSLCVVGCSTSEVGGKMIGSASSEEIAAAIWEGLTPVLEKAGVFLAVQGCEHINRSLCVSRACMERFGLTEVMVQPWLHAGGAFVTHAFAHTEAPVMVEDLRGLAHLGMDIGGTLIGMHLKAVAVPVRLEHCRIGEALVLSARTRPKFIGGVRAHYNEDLL